MGTSRDCRLGGRFLALVPPEVSTRGAPPDLDDLLDRCFAQARAAWPDVALADDDFLCHIAAHVALDRDLGTSLRELFAADLYLACACARRDPTAIAHFDKRFLGAALRSWSGGHRFASAADDVRQTLRIRLLVSDGAEPPRIASYAGRGPLEAWVRMAATRLALNMKKGERAHLQDDDDAAWLRSPEPDPELDYLKTRYADDLKQALRITLAALSARTANVLRLYYQEAMTLGAIATMYQVSSRTVQRWLAEARQTILDETQRLLRERLGLSDSQLDSLIGLVSSRLDLSLYRYLPGRADGE